MGSASVFAVGMMISSAPIMVQVRMLSGRWRSKAYDYAHLSERRVKDLEAVGRGSVIILLVKLLGLRDMHHFRTVEHLALRIYPQRGVVSLPSSSRYTFGDM